VYTYQDIKYLYFYKCSCYVVTKGWFPHTPPCGGKERKNHMSACRPICNIVYSIIRFDVSKEENIKDVAILNSPCVYFIPPLIVTYVTLLCATRLKSNITVYLIPAVTVTWIVPEHLHSSARHVTPSDGWCNCIAERWEPTLLLSPRKCMEVVVVQSSVISEVCVRARARVCVWIPAQRHASWSKYPISWQ
jgi:hypothetical protein